MLILLIHMATQNVDLLYIWTILLNFVLIVMKIVILVVHIVIGTLKILCIELLLQFTW